MITNRRKILVKDELIKFVVYPISALRKGLHSRVNVHWHEKLVRKKH